MIASTAKDPQRALGRSPDNLSLEERLGLMGKHVALEIYTPEGAPARRIEAIADSVQECIRQLVARGLDPAQFEFSRLSPPY